nr:hypothetical protein [Tanacetum cinerariifolium]
MTLAQFTKHFPKTTSSIFSPTPPREPTPLKDESKGKCIDIEEPLKDIMPFMKEGGSVLFHYLAEDQKRKMTEILKEVFVTENITVDGMHKKLIPSPGLCQSMV